MSSRIHSGVAFLLVLLAACGDAPTAHGGRPQLLRVEGLVPGGSARVIGRSLSEVRGLTVAGDVVSELTVLSDSVLTFRVPVLRACETDGRRVLLATDLGDTLRAPLSVAGTVELDVGESRVLDDAALSCVQLPARDEDYVLSVASTSMPVGDVEAPRQLLLLRTWTESDGKPEFLGPQPSRLERAETHTLARGPELYSEDPVPFDERYATAQVGESVTMVDWRFTEADNRTLCALPKSQVPTFQARIVAVAGRVVIAVDPRHPQAAGYLDPAANGWLQQAAQIAEPVLVPAMRAVFDPAFEPLRGGGGRYYALLTTLGGGTGYAYDGAWPGGTGASQAGCAHASEMTTVRVNAAAFSSAQYQQPHKLASLLIHEYAHNAEARIHLRAGQPSNAAWYLNEAWAALTEETAARLASGQPQAARWSQLSAQVPDPGVWSAGTWGRLPGSSPWQMNGRYTLSAQMLLYLRELAGEVGTTRTGETFHDRLYAVARDWKDHAATVPVLAAAVGLSYHDLIDRFTLASVTAGLLPAGVVSARGLPHFQAWDLADLAVAEGPRTAASANRLSRSVNQAADLLVAAGGHGALYLQAEDGRGISLQALAGDQSARIVRLTRLR